MRVGQAPAGVAGAEDGTEPFAEGTIDPLAAGVRVMVSRWEAGVLEKSMSSRTGPQRDERRNV